MVGDLGESLWSRTILVLFFEKIRPCVIIGRQFNPQIQQSRGRSQNRSYNQKIIRIGIGQTIDQTVGIEDSSGKTEVDTDLSKVIEEVVSEIIPEDTVDRIAEESIGIIVIEMMAITEAGIGLEKDHFQEILVVIKLKYMQ